jgi:hypothetical protein
VVAVFAIFPAYDTTSFVVRWTPPELRETRKVVSGIEAAANTA